MNLRLKDFIRVYDNALPASFCEDLTARFEQDAALAVERRHEEQLAFLELNIDPLPQWRTINQNLNQAKEYFYQQYQQDCPGMYPEKRDYEAFRIKKYNPKANHRFEEHVDSYDLTTSRRFLVCFWYLNDVAEGGETRFTKLKIDVRPKQGRLIMFPPYWMYQHAGLLPVSNDKYIISTYLTFD